VDLYIHSALRLHGVVRDLVSTGITLHFHTVYACSYGSYYYDPIRILATCGDPQRFVKPDSDIQRSTSQRGPVFKRKIVPSIKVVLEPTILGLERPTTVRTVIN
jgi:hypothetical protein